MIAVFGGVFDPVHFGHIKPVYQLLTHPEVEQIRLLPCYIPPHKDKPTSDEHRLAMLALMVRSPDIVVDTREIDRGSVSFTIDSLRDLRVEFGTKKSLAFVLGADAFATITQWHEYSELTQYAHLIVTSRPGYEIDANHSLRRQCGDWSDLSILAATTAGKICLFQNKLFDISSTQVRGLLIHGEQPRYLIPGVIWNYIRHNHLYEHTVQA